MPGGCLWGGGGGTEFLLAAKNPTKSVFAHFFQGTCPQGVVLEGGPKKDF